MRSCARPKPKVFNAVGTYEWHITTYQSMGVFVHASHQHKHQHKFAVRFKQAMQMLFDLHWASYRLIKPRITAY